jgi:proteasome lid subunit RPN8/RPN11
MSEREEEWWRRPGPTSAYRPSDLCVRAPADAVAQTLALLRSAGHREAACLWLGARSATDERAIQVEAVVMPKQINERRNFTIPAQANQEVATFARIHGFKIAAAIHSHPGTDVEHSEYDDRMTASRRALSLVFPSYGHYDPNAWPTGAGVHEYVDGYWHLLTDEQARVPLRIESGWNATVVDLR